MPIEEMETVLVTTSVPGCGTTVSVRIIAGAAPPVGTNTSGRLLLVEEEVASVVENTEWKRSASEVSDSSALLSMDVLDAFVSGRAVGNGTGGAREGVADATEGDIMLASIPSTSSSRASTAWMNLRRLPGRSESPSWMSWMSSMALLPAVIDAEMSSLTGDAESTTTTGVARFECWCAALW